MTFRVDGVSASYSQLRRNCHCDRRLEKITVAVSVLCGLYQSNPTGQEIIFSATCQKRSDKAKLPQNFRTLTEVATDPDMAMTEKSHIKCSFSATTAK